MRRLRLKATHYAIMAFHAAVLLDTCYYCRSAGSVDELGKLLALLRGGGAGAGPSPAGLLRAALFWGLVAAASALYLAAGTADPGYLPCALGPAAAPGEASETLAARFDLAEAPSEGLLGQAAVLSTAGSVGPRGGSARDVAMKMMTTPGGVSYVYDEEEVDEEIGSGPEARPPAGQQGSSLGAAAAAAALGGAAVALGGFGLAGSSGGPDLDEAAREAAESEGFAFRALGDGPAEERPCKVCRCALPLRAKHCFECGRCVRTHDHHCPWIANCVGERNRALFFWFVALQGAEAWWLLSQQGRCLGSEAARSGLFVVALVLVALFAFCLGSLSLCHAWLMATNITTWEYLRWRRIPYLRALPPEGGSPFSTSLAGNAAIYCLGGGCGRAVELLRLALRGPRFGAVGARLAQWLDAPRSPEGYGGGHMAATGEIAWQVGAQHVPCLVKNRWYSCYFPPGHG